MDGANGISRTTRLGLAVLGAGLALGVLADALLRATPWGLNVPLCAGAAVVAATALLRAGRVEATGGGRWLVLPLLGFAAAVAWRDSPALTLLNGLALLAALALAVARTRAGRVRVAGLVDYLLAGLVAGFCAAFGIIQLLFEDIGWRELPRDRRWYGPLAAAGRGLVIAAPLLVLFGGLFAAADAVFEGLVGSLFRWNIATVLTHLILIGIYTQVTGGLLRAVVLMREQLTLVGQEVPPFLSLSVIEVGVALGLLNVLFLSFVLVQLRYLFGGAAQVTASTGLTYAEYARRGFFELVAVAALVLPLLLGVHWLVRKDNPAHERVFRLLAGALVALLFVIMASALLRMRLYQQAYGLTELRLYTTAFMGWLALVFIWFLATVLRARRERFAFVALIAAFAVLLLLDGLNPDALIVRTNVNRAGAAATDNFDERYASGLSADAVPALIEALPAMSEPKRATVARTLLARWLPPTSRDWRTWNWGRTRAWQAVEANRASLEGMRR